MSIQNLKNTYIFLSRLNIKIGFPLENSEIKITFPIIKNKKVRTYRQMFILCNVYIQ